MKIGHIRREKGKDDKTWLVMDLAIPLAGRTRLTVSLNRSKQTGSNQPDYHLWYNMNARGQSDYKSARVGSLWNKRSRDGATEYKDGYIEHPFAPGGRMQIAVFAAKPQDGETLSYTHEITWNPPRGAASGGGYDGGYAEPAYTPPQPPQTQSPQQASPNPHPQELPEIDINEDEIPF